MNDTFSYQYLDEKRGNVFGGIVATAGFRFYIKYEPPKSKDNRITGSKADSFRLVSKTGLDELETDADVVFGPDEEGGNYWIMVPSNYTGECEAQVILLYRDDDDESGVERQVFIRWRVLIYKLGEIVKTQGEKLLDKVNALIDERLEQNVDPVSSSYFQSEGVAMSFATLSELIAFRTQLYREISFQRTGGIFSRKVITSGNYL